VEYHRMVAEKAIAAQRSVAALMTGKSFAAALAPYSTRARANATRASEEIIRPNLIGCSIPRFP
jgi:hypothetical protein